MSAKRVLVTGAGGFIGRWSLEPLRRLGFEVYAAVSPRGVGRYLLAAATPGALPAAEVLRVDLTDARIIDALIERVRPTHLLHFAWVVTPGVYWSSPDNYRWMAASNHLLDSFHRAGGVRAVLAGSCAEYDWTQVGICDERLSPLAAHPERSTPYTACKIALQRALEQRAAEWGMSSAWGRIFFQYGPGEHRSRLVASVIVDLLSGRRAACSHGRQVRSFLHVEDVGSAFAALVASDVQGAVNVGSAERVTLADLLQRVALQIGRPELLELGAREPAPNEPAVLVPELERLSRGVGFEPRWTLDAGIADTIRWWRGELAMRP